MHSNDKDTQLIWERYVAEGIFGNSSPQNISQVTTYGELNQLVSGIIQSAKTGEQVTAVGGFALDQVLGMIPGASNVKSAFDLFKSLYWSPDSKKTNTPLDAFNVDDKTSQMLDDTVENNFLQVLNTVVSKYPPEKEIDPNWNVTQELNRYLRKTFARGIDDKTINQ